MLKHAESGTGGIPRRAFNNPRAMGSLGSSNLSSQLRPFNGSYVPPVGVDPNRPPYNNPTLTGKTFVTAGEARFAVNRLRGRIAKNEAAMKKIQKSGGDPARSAAALDNNVATQELRAVQSQISDSAGGGLFAARPAILVPNSVIGSGNQALKPYGVRPPSRQIDAEVYGRKGRIDVG